MTSKKIDGSNLLDKVLAHPLSRRRFIQASTAATGAAVVAGTLLKPSSAKAANDPGTPDALETDAGVDVRYSVCLGCHGKCGIAVRVQNDTVLKVDGNPWHHNCNETGDRLDFADTPAMALTKKSGLCPKGQSGPQVMHNPFRIKTPLRRMGARGSGKWEAISWDVALNEIAAKLKPYYDGYAAGTDLPTADNSGAFGTIANQVLFSPGRLQHGQKEFTDRIWGKGFGTVNKRHDHTSICETSHHVAGEFHSEMKKEHWKPDVLKAKYILWFGTNPLEANFPSQSLARKIALSKINGTDHVIIDPRHSRSAAKAKRWLPIKPGGDTALAMGIAHQMLTHATWTPDYDFLAAGNNLAALDETRASASGTGTKAKQFQATDATWLVIVKAATPGEEWVYRDNAGAYQVLDPDNSGALTDLDRNAAAAAQWGKLWVDIGDAGGTAEAASLGTNGLDPAVVGTNVINLDGGTTYAVPVYQLYEARVLGSSLDEYAANSGIDAATITVVANEFIAGGRQSVATGYRGACKHHNGVNMTQAVLLLNCLVGNYDWAGGNCAGTGGHLHEDGTKKPGQIKVKSAATSTRSPTGPQITRVKSYFDAAMQGATGESIGATKRPWFPYALFGNYQEIVPSIDAQYPYAAKALISYWNNIPYSTPAAKEASYRVLTDTQKLPLFVSFDIEMSEMASLADYILPDGSFFERWSTPHNAPSILGKMSGVRSPVAGWYANKAGGPNNETYWQALANGRLLDWDYTINWATDAGPFTLEDILLSLASRVAGGIANLDAFGNNAYYADAAAMTAAGVSPSIRNKITSAWDFYHNLLVNLAIDAGAPPNNAAAIQTMVTQIVERGGWFDDTAVDGTGEYDLADNPVKYVASKAALSAGGRSLHMFFEYKNGDGTRYVDAYSGKYHDPLPKLMPVLDANGDVVQNDPSLYPFQIVTYKPMYHAQGRTDSLPVLTNLEPENFVEMNSADARRLGLWTGDKVKLTSASNGVGITGRVKSTERIRPGVLAVSHSRGRWENTTRPYAVSDGSGGVVSSGFGRRRGKGLNTNPIMRLDPSLGDVTLQDPIGGSSAFYDTMVRVERYNG